MAKLVHHSEKFGCGATIELDSGEICMISVAQAGVLVRSYKRGIVGVLLLGPFFGAILYEEKNVYKAAEAAEALLSLYPEYLMPISCKNIVLRAFANAVWQCATAAEVSIVLNSAVQKGQSNEYR